MDNPGFNAPTEKFNSPIEKGAQSDSAQVNQLYSDLGSLNSKLPESTANKYLPDVQISGEDPRSVGDAGKQGNPGSALGDGRNATSVGNAGKHGNPGSALGDGRSEAARGSGDGKSPSETDSQIRSAYENIAHNHAPREFKSVSEAMSEASAANSRAIRIAQAMQKLV